MRRLRPEPQYATFEQQASTAQLGMWAFIATEVLFFGALVFSYAVYRATYGADFTIAGKDAKLLLGSINSAILLTSSLTMVMAINFAKEGRERLLMGFLLATVLLGVAFLGVKGYEYVTDYDDATVPSLDFALKPGERPPGELFWVFYFIATGFHAVHMTVGIGLVLWLIWLARRRVFSPNYVTPLEVVGLYWSFVDVVWIFLFSAIYPLGRGPL
jgi:cytochrome c oxidase subunit 3